MMLQALFKELRRRRVFRVAAAYAVVGWLLIQVVTQIFPALQLDADLTTAAVVLIIIGFPVAIVLAWAYDITPQGVIRTETPPAPAAPFQPTPALRPPLVPYAPPPPPRAVLPAEPVEVVPPDPERVR